MFTRLLKSQYKQINTMTIRQTSNQNIYCFSWFFTISAYLPPYPCLPLWPTDLKSVKYLPSWEWWQVKVKLYIRGQETQAPETRGQQRRHMVTMLRGQQHRARGPLWAPRSSHHRSASWSTQNKVTETKYNIDLQEWLGSHCFLLFSSIWTPTPTSSWWGF